MGMRSRSVRGQTGRCQWRRPGPGSSPRTGSGSKSATGPASYPSFTPHGYTADKRRQGRRPGGKTRSWNEPLITTSTQQGYYGESPGSELETSAIHNSESGVETKSKSNASNHYFKTMCEPSLELGGLRLTCRALMRTGVGHACCVSHIDLRCSHRAYHRHNLARRNALPLTLLSPCTVIVIAVTRDLPCVLCILLPLARR